MFVPGGQSELCEHAQKVDEDEVVICMRHKGFIRIAMNVASDYQEKIRIIPIVAFGESSGVRNIFKRFISKKSYRYFGFPFPFIPVGIYFTPFPTRQSLYYAIGKGVSIEPNTSQTIEAIHKQYYEQVRTLFEKHKKLAKNSAHLRLRLVQS
jgi:2-acylglycerol O-acyltransferase 2|tara:strand:+ start:160 stop:615 length:456 start_codon:yes stop_codon:yes gene_type:complete